MSHSQHTQLIWPVCLLGGWTFSGRPERENHAPVVYSREKGGELAYQAPPVFCVPLIKAPHPGN